MKAGLPFGKDQIEKIVEDFPTPFHIYDEAGILENFDNLKKAFSWSTGFREYFAVKATPNPFLMAILNKHGAGMDCSSLAELELSQAIGVSGEEIMFTSNNTPIEEYHKALELGAILNLDDLTQLDYISEHLEIPDLISFRLNPGEHLGGSDIIGNPMEAKFGLLMEQLPVAFLRAKDLGAKRFGLHTMPISNELDQSYFIGTTKLLLSCVKSLSAKLGIDFEFINIGGGIGIPYLPEDQAVDIFKLGRDLENCFKEEMAGTPFRWPKLFMECGRYITGPYGYLVTRAIHTKSTYRRYIGVDATMADLMRPGMYGAYHHISVLGKETAPTTEVYDVVGALCENNDKFAIQRSLPKIETGDFVVIHDTGAHGHSMGFNYNGKLRSAELLLRADGSVSMIRRAETLNDYFQTLDFSKLKSFI